MEVPIDFTDASQQKGDILLESYVPSPARRHSPEQVFDRRPGRQTPPAAEPAPAGRGKTGSPRTEVRQRPTQELESTPAELLSGVQPPRVSLATAEFRDSPQRTTIRNHEFPGTAQSIHKIDPKINPATDR